MLKELYSLFAFIYGTVVYFIYTGDKQVLISTRQIIETASKAPDFRWSIQD